jgi:hypothetical protein
MSQKFGNYIEREEGTGEYLKLSFHPSSIPLQQRWRNNGLSADFLAGYVSTFFPGEDPISAERQIEIKDAISYIANELLENAMKFSYGPSRHTVSIEMFLEADMISLYSVNSLDPDKLGSFEQFIQRLLTEDPSELYIAQLERNAEDDSDGASSLGYLTMLNDYGATVAWKFSETGQDEVGTAVTTMVQLAV